MLKERDFVVTSETATIIAEKQKILRNIDKKIFLGRALYRYYNGENLINKEIEAIAISSDSEKVYAYELYCESRLRYLNKDQLNAFQKNTGFIKAHTKQNYIE